MKLEYEQFGYTVDCIVMSIISTPCIWSGNKTGLRMDRSGDVWSDQHKSHTHTTFGRGM